MQNPLLLLTKGFVIMNNREPDNEKLEARVYSFEEFLEEKGHIVFTIVGCSMTPFLRQRRDLVVIQKKETERCKKYDVVFYKRGDKYILHRILRVSPNGYLIAGDHCTFIENDIKDDNILGVLTHVIRNGKTITPDNFWYRLYIHIWCDAYPLRFFIIKTKIFIHRNIYRCLRFIKKRVFR